MLNRDVAEELDAYGGHLTVVIASDDGTLYEVAQVTSSSRSEGVLVVIETGDVYEG